MNGLLSTFQSVGSLLYGSGMVSMHGGNLSVRQGEKVVITRSGSRLGFLAQDDLVETGLSQDDENTGKASSELAVHRAIYRQTPFKAIVHCHPVYAVALSFVRHIIHTEDEAGKLFIPQVPVVGMGREPVPGGYADEIAEALKTNAAAMVHRHGSFARGMTLDEAFVMTELLEISCRTIYLVKNLKL
jgi:L-fuculose-phosphate aldolase